MTDISEWLRATYEPAQTLIPNRGFVGNMGRPKIQIDPEALADAARRHIEEYATTEDIAREFGVGLSTIRRRFRENGYAIRPRGAWTPNMHTAHQDINHSRFSTIDDEESAYWLGMLLADGNIHGDRITLGLKASDAYMLECFRDFIGGGDITIRAGGLQKTPSGTSVTEGMGIFRVSSQPIANSLRSLGILPAKSKAPSLPAPDVASHLERHFWRGTIDGDGCIMVRDVRANDRISLHGHPDTIEAFSKYATRVIGRTVTHHAAKSADFAQCGGSGALALCRELYGDANISLDRKHEKAMEIISRWSQ